MNGLEIIRKSLDSMPASSGVYRMIGKDGKPIYIGKAKDLKKRITSYTHLEKLSLRIQKMVMQTSSIEVVTTNNEADALLLECNMIKNFRPRYNILLKDDKSFPYITIYYDHAFPRIGKHRGERKKDGVYFGPFASAGDVNSALAAIQRAFLIRPCSDSIFKSRTRPCLEYQIKRCSAPCVGKISKEDYAVLVKQAKDFLLGKSAAIQNDLAQQMREASKEQDYEKAAVYRDRIKALAVIQARQNINARNVDDADIVGMFNDGKQACLQVFFIRGGKTLGNKAFFPSQTEGFSDAEIMEAFLASFYESNPAPAEIYLSQYAHGRKVLEEALVKISGHKININIPIKGEKRNLVEAARKNAEEALIRRQKEGDGEREILARLAAIFEVEKEINRIEVYDNSHIFGKHPVGAMIVAGPEGFLKNEYRRYNVNPGTKTTGGDDYAMLREVLTRRFSRLKNDENAIYPDLILIDGGSAHMKIAGEVFADLGVDVPFACIAKGQQRNAGKEQFHIPGKKPFRLEEKDHLLYYLQRIRDEAHRFAIMSHRSKRAKAATKSSLDSIPGIGAARKKAILNHFGSVKVLEQASVEEIIKIPGINRKTAEIIYSFLHE